MSDRRDFLKKVFTLSIFSVAAPRILLGELQPTEILEDKDGNKLQDVYHLDLEQYPDLMEDYGCIELELRDREDALRTLYVTRVPEELSDVGFSVLSNICPHEHMLVNPLHPDEHTFECTGHGSIFDVFGNWVSGPAAQRLTNYTVVGWEPGDRYVRIIIDFYKNSVESDALHSYMSRNYPNPFANKTTLRYGIDKDAIVYFVIYDIAGRKLITTSEQFLSADDYEYPLDMSGYPSGKYIARMNMNGAFVKSITLNKER